MLDVRRRIAEMHKPHRRKPSINTHTVIFHLQLNILLFITHKSVVAE